MRSSRTCKQCGSSLENKKLGAKYCDHACQQGYYKRKKKLLDQIAALERTLRFNLEWIKEINQELNELEKKKVNPRVIESEVQKIEHQLNSLNQLLSSDENVFTSQLVRYLDRNMERYGSDYALLKFGAVKDQQLIIQKHRFQFESIRKKMQIKLNNLSKKCDQIKRDNKHKDLQWLQLSLKLAGVESEVETIQNKIQELHKIDLENLPVRYDLRKEHKPESFTSTKGVKGDQILKMKFNSLKLKGELGKFLGSIQRNKCAIALTGDSGAGKTTFSFQLAKAFLDANQSVGYFSLESGITETTQQIIERLNLVSRNFEVYEDGTLENVQQKANQFDCIIIDSYSKISTKSNDFEMLRQTYPNTFFIVIFQKTTDGKIRGGSSILYNSTATIDIRLTHENHRIALMQKSRYGTENFVYSISLNICLKMDRNPIKWSQIEEKWPSPNRH